MTIVTNQYADVIDTDDEGNALPAEEHRLFGKMGFQTMGENTDGKIMANMLDLEAALDAGELEDLAGNKVTNNAVIWLPTLVTKVADPNNRKHVSRFRNASGSFAAVPEAEEAPEDDEAPF